MKSKFERLEVINEAGAIQFLEQSAYNRSLKLLRARVVKDNLKEITNSKEINRTMRTVQLNILIDGDSHELFITTILETPEVFDEEGHFKGRDLQGHCFLESKEKGFLATQERLRNVFLDAIPKISEEYFGELNPRGDSKE